MFGIGMGELILILIVGLVLFGAEGLRDVARLFGKVMKEFRKAQASLQDTLDDIDDEKPKQNQQSQKSQESTSNPIETYQPPTQESVRASLEKFSEKSAQTQSIAQSKEEQNLG